MTKGLYPLLGLIAYAIFFTTFLYLIAFVGDAPLVPLTVDRGPVAQPLVAASIDVALIALFGVQHSVMARQGFKRAWTRIVPEPLERSAYVLAASVVLIVLFVGWRPLPGAIWSIGNPIAFAAMWTVFALGWGIVLFSTFLINHFELFGLKQVWGHARGHEPVAPVFRTPFLYRLVRHPLYSGFVLAFWATPHMTVGHLILALGMTCYIVIAIGYEERDLTGLFGDRYARYRQDVGMLVPRMRSRR